MKVSKNSMYPSIFPLRFCINPLLRGDLHREPLEIHISKICEISAEIVRKIDRILKTYDEI